MDDQLTRRNALLNIAGESVWGLKANLVVPSVILAVLLYQFGASPELIGAISAIEISMQLIPQMAGQLCVPFARPPQGRSWCSGITWSCCPLP